MISSKYFSAFLNLEQLGSISKMQLSQLEGETNLLIFGVQGQGRMLTSKFCLNNKCFFFSFKRSLFSEQFDIKLMKTGLLKVEIRLLKVCGSGDYAQS